MAEQTEYATAVEVRELQEQMKSLLQEKERESSEQKNQEVRELKQKLEEKDWKIIRLEQELETLKKKWQEFDDQFTLCDVPPYDLTATNYKSIVDSYWGCPKYWKSDDYYTHPGGYKFHINVHVPSIGVTFHPEPGEYDDTLPWPARVSITIELRNQRSNRQHIDVTRRLEWGRKDTGSSIFSISSSFIPQENLDLNQKLGTMYLRNNCLRFRITKIQVRKSTYMYM